MKRKTALLCALLAVLLLFAGCGLLPASPTENEAPVTTTAEIPPVPTATADGPGPADWSSLTGKGKVGTVLPDFSVATADGGSFQLSKALEDHELVLINLWATWCPPCNMEFPFLEQAYQSYQDRVAVIALSVEVTDTDEVLREFAAKKKLSFPMGRDENHVLSQAFRVDNIPTSLLVDQNRQVIWMEVGAKSSAEEFTELFDTYLKGGSTAGMSEYRITVLDQDGAPVPGAVINFCTEEQAFQKISDESGLVLFIGEPYAYRVQVDSVPDGYDYTGSNSQFVKAEGDEMTLTLTRLG